VKKIAILITFLFLVKPISPVLSYFINYEYITNELCENQDKPEMECNGKCHLKKELAKASSEESSTSKDKKSVNKQEIEVLNYQNAIYFEIKKSVFNVADISTYYFNNYFHLISSQIFHPPTKLV
jgi:hypothetical protein